MAIDRRERLLAGLDLPLDRGLEVGPLDSPIVVRPGADVVYLDHATTEDLIRKYDGDPNVGAIVTVDEVWGDATLGEVLAGRIAARGPFRYAVASHVIEHVPDVVGWLQQLASVIEVGGTLRLAVPDKRFCFDANRSTTDVGALVAAHLEGRTRPSVAAVFDFWSRYTHVDAGRLWAGEDPPPIGPGQDTFALSKASESYGAADYHDVHCWVFTPASFLEVVDRLAIVGMLPFEVQDLQPTIPGEVEFFVVLERLPDDLDPEARLARQQAAVERLRAAVASAAAGSTGGAADEGGVDARVSPKELRLIEAKRRAATSARSLVDKVRRR